MQDASDATAAVPLRLLRVVGAVAAAGGATQASRALHQSVSAVTRAVQQAESMLGLPLFERGARGMVATPAGALLSLRVRRALAEFRAGPAPELASRGTDAMLRAMTVVAETRSEAATAARLGITQPAVHATLRALEHAARVRLLERSRRGTRLTEAGERVLLQASLALAELRSGLDELAAMRGLAPGRVTVGALPMSSEVLVPQALSRLFKVDPRACVTVVDGTYEALLYQLRHGQVDFVVGPLRGAASPPDVEETQLFVDHLLPVARAGHPLLATRARRDLRALCRWPWVGPLPGTPARAAFERVFERAGLTPPPVSLQANSPSVVRAVLLGGDPVALVSPLQIRAELAAGALAVIPVALSGTERSIGITQRRGALASTTCRQLLDALHQVTGAADLSSPAAA